MAQRDFQPREQTQIEAGMLLASRIFHEVGVALEWHKSGGICGAGPGKAIVITLSQTAAASNHPNAFAYAQPFEGVHIVVFYHRVEMAVDGFARYVPAVLGHVLAHEIAHVLQAKAQHSPTGIMKQHWDPSDYRRMIRVPLEFTPHDVLLMQAGPWGADSRAAPGGDE
ncbi:MAG: M56 family metallopeptidase [Acidobacteriia bacterium]|nr:M56 family metallopeptidase [Terriglobia bacterium]